MQNTHITNCTNDLPDNEMDYDDEEYEDNTSFQQQAFNISKPGKDFDPSIAPRNGDEYLMHMLYERRRCPAVMVATHSIEKKEIPATADEQDVKTSEPTLKIVSKDEFQAPDAELSPTEQWKVVQVERFLDARQKVQKMRCRHAARVIGESKKVQIPPNPTDSMQWHSFCREHPPLMDIMLSINQRTMEQLLDHIMDWLNGQVLQKDDDHDGDDDDGDQDVNDAGDADDNGLSTDLNLCLSGWLGRWLYSVLACLREPIEPHVHSTLRNIARTCLRNRNKLSKEESQKAAPYNVFICLITKVFDQLDIEEFL